MVQGFCSLLLSVSLASVRQSVASVQESAAFVHESVASVRESVASMFCSVAGTRRLLFVSFIRESLDT